MTALAPIPLPLVDGAFLIDNSACENFQNCPRDYYIKHVLKRVPSAPKAGRNFGSGMHKGAEARYNRCGIHAVDDAASAFINDAIVKYFTEHPQPAGDFRTANHALTVMAAYNDIYREEPFQIVNSPRTGKPIIEATCALPLGTVQGIQIVYTGKLDLGIRNNDGLWSKDLKTAFQFGDGFLAEKSMDGGQLGYCWMLGEVLGERPSGYIIDAVRVRRPKKSDEYMGVAPVDSTDFMRVPYYINQDNLDEWKEDVLHIVADIFWCYDRGFFPRHRKSCVGKYGKCDFFEACIVMRANRDETIRSSMYEDNTWSPLKQEEE